MRRGDVAVLSISSVLATIVVAAVTYSVTVLDRSPSTTTFQSDSTTSTWLVVTWGPSLCKVEPSNRGCTSGHVGSVGPAWLLHGLWPQPFDNQYCGLTKEVADRARKIGGADAPSVDLAPNVRDNLQALMSDAASLAPHEWYAHGTCSGTTPDVFFTDAATLARQAKEVIDPMFADAEGTSVTLSAVRDRFDSAFGQGAGARVGLSCRNVTGEGSLAYEMHLSLPPVADLRNGGDTLSLTDLLVQAPALDGGCRHGFVP